MVCQFWEEKEVAQVTDPVPFCIHETDKVFVREHIVETVIGAPEPVRCCHVLFMWYFSRLHLCFVYVYFCVARGTISNSSI